MPLSLNDLGATAGKYLDADYVCDGFLRSPDGKITTFDAPGAGNLCRQLPSTFPREHQPGWNHRHTRRPRYGVIRVRRPQSSSESRAIFLKGQAHGCHSKDPELRLRHRSGHFNGEFDGIERIAVAVHDERSSLDRREVRRSEVHIVITGGKRFCTFEESPSLRLTSRMMTAKNYPLLCGEAFHIPTHDGTAPAVESKLSH